MTANDLLIQIRADLQEKSEFWKPEELFVKLQRSYTSLQWEMPSFIHKEILSIKEGIEVYQLRYSPLKSVSFKIDGTSCLYSELECFYTNRDNKRYSFDGKRLLLSEDLVLKESAATLVYKYARELQTMNCEIEIPEIYMNALRLIFLSNIHEKPTGSTKVRNLSTHYLNLYNREIRNLKINKKLRAKNVTSKYQVV